MIKHSVTYRGLRSDEAVTRINKIAGIEATGEVYFTYSTYANEKAAEKVPDDRRVGPNDDRPAKTVEKPIPDDQDREVVRVAMTLEEATLYSTFSVPGKNPEGDVDNLKSQAYRILMARNIFENQEIA